MESRPSQLALNLNLELTNHFCRKEKQLKRTEKKYWQNQLLLEIAYGI
jgi:hypothetical protein